MAPNIIQAHKKVLQLNNTQLKGVSSINFVLIKATSRLVVALTYFLTKYQTKYLCVWLKLKHMMVQEIRTPSNFNILMLIIIIAYLLNNRSISQVDYVEIKFRWECLLIFIFLHFLIL